MTGVVFVICIPSEEQEKCLQNKNKKKVTIESEPRVIQISEGFSINANGNTPKNDKGNKENNMPMEKLLQKILIQLEISHWTWNKSEDDMNIQIIFPVQCSHKTEEILDVLKENKIGKKFNSIVSVVPCTIHYHGDINNSSDNEEISENVKHDDQDKNTGWNWFLTSVKSRLIVDQVVENVRAQSALSFDFISMLLISTSLCALGLVENSNVYLISSMLISPMMGPVMAGTFGLVVRDRKLLKMGFKNEVISLGLATLVGFFFGSFICFVTDKYGEQEWPTYEMVSRGELRILWTGCLTALLSGAAVALGILSDNIAMLVGVAISTSLMPPAVNAGLLWSMASVYSLKGNNTTRYSTLTHTGKYFENSTLELLSLGAVSICLTFVNIICIYSAGILVFKIKEVAPMTSRDPSKRRFWRHDIKMARDYNKTFQNNEARQLLRAYSQQTSEYQQEKRLDELLHHSTEIPKGNFKVNVSRSEYTWSPCMDSSKRPNLDELKDLYSDLVKNKPGANKRLNFGLPKEKEGHHRRLSQIFNPLAKEVEKLNTIEEGGAEKCPLVRSPNNEENAGKCSQNFFCGNRKFVVTPCECDPLKKEFTY